MVIGIHQVRRLTWISYMMISWELCNVFDVQIYWLPLISDPYLQYIVPS